MYYLPHFIMSCSKFRSDWECFLIPIGKKGLHKLVVWRDGYYQKSNISTVLTWDFGEYCRSLGLWWFLCHEHSSNRLELYSCLKWDAWPCYFLHMSDIVNTQISSLEMQMKYLITAAQLQTPTTWPRAAPNASFVAFLGMKSYRLWMCLSMDLCQKLVLLQRFPHIPSSTCSWSSAKPQGALVTLYSFCSCHPSTLVEFCRSCRTSTCQPSMK